jgi:hypothetical protein
MGTKIKYITISLAFICIMFLPASGCMKMALRMSPELFENISASIFEECDPDLAQKAIPSNLKLLEGILKNDPDNPLLLRLLSTGFCGYRLPLFITGRLYMDCGQ